MKDYSAQIKGIIEGDEDPPEDDQNFIYASGEKLSEASSIWHLESYRSRLMSRLSREDVISGLKVVSIPEVFADPPVFSIVNYIRSNDDANDLAEVETMMKKYNGTFKPMRTKSLLTEFMEECELDP